MYSETKNPLTKSTVKGKSKGQTVNIDWTVGMSLFLLTSLTAILFLTNFQTGPDRISGLESKNVEVQQNLEEAASIEGRRISLIAKGPTALSDIPIDRYYNFPSDAYPESGGGDIPAELDIVDNNIVAVTDSNDVSHSLIYFTENVSKASYTNDIQTNDSWINNSHIDMKIGSSSIESLQINGQELLNQGADLGSGDDSITESGIYAETLSGDLRAYDNSPELILDDRTENLTFNLQNLDTLYWYENDTTIPLTGTGKKVEGSTKGFTIASDHGITFLGNITTTVSRPDSSTVRAEIDAEKIRIRLHDSDYSKGKERIKFYDKGYIVLGSSQKFSSPYASKIKQLNSLSEIDFENTLQTDNFDYNIGFGTWLHSLANRLSDWNQGEFNATSASRKDNSGDLGLGYREGNVEDSLVGYWRLDRTSGQIRDYSGNNNDGVNNGASRGENGIFGTNSFRFDGSDDTVSISDSNELDGFENGITISIWVYSRQDEKGDYSWILQKNTFGNAPYYWADEGGGNGDVNIRIEDSEDNRYSVNPGLNYREWTHLSITYNPETNNYRGFRNGELIEEKNIGEISINSNDDEIKLASGGPGGPWKGKLDELQIYSRPLSIEEISQLYKHGQNGDFKGEYTIENMTGSFQRWNGLTINAEIPSETNAEAVFESLDSNGNVVDSYTIQLQSGQSSYNINSESSSGYRLIFRGNSSNPEKSWEIKSYDLEYGPQLKRGNIIPLDTSAVVSDKTSALINRNGSFSEAQNRVVLWR